MTDDIYISWEDLKRVILKHSRSIMRAGILGTALGFLYCLFTPLAYQADAVFRQAQSSSDRGFDFRNLLRTFSSGAVDGAAIPLMLSRTVLGKTVEELGLQIQVGLPNRRLKNNFLAELGKKPSDLDLFEFRQVLYPEEKSQQFYLSFSSPTTFNLLNAHQHILTKGSLNRRVSCETFSFTLVQTPRSLQLKKLYPLTCIPRQQAVGALKSHLKIKPLKDDRNILTIAFQNPCRQRAARVVNTLMAEYEKFLTLQNQIIITEQLGYLRQRQDELSRKLDQEVQDHTLALQKSLASEGFMGIEEEMSAILEPLQNYRQRIGEIEVEMAALAEPVKKNVLASRIANASYLSSVFASLAARQKALREASAEFEDFSGMTLPACQELFRTYSHQLDDLQAQMKQVIFFQDHLQEPHFELSTLSNVLTDSVTQKLVQTSTEIEGQLCDTINHSEREHSRLKETLATQKRFLKTHLTQTLELGKIRTQLLQEKLHSLHRVMHHLLQKEKGVLEQKIEELKSRLKSVPELWHLDKRLKFRAELTKGMMEGLTQITESKNLAQHLYQVESRPLDPALVPDAPLPPRIVLKSAAAGASTAFILSLFFLIQAFFKGLPASLATLRLMGARTAGVLPSLETLREIATFVRLQKPPSVISVLGEKSLEACFQLAKLLSFQHHKIIFIDCHHSDHSNGLWQYLQNPAAALSLEHHPDYNFLPAGPTNPFNMELLASSRFQELLAQLKNHYDFIFLFKQSSLASQEAVQLLQIADCAIVVTFEESVATLMPYLEKERATFAESPYTKLS